MRPCFGNILAAALAIVSMSVLGCGSSAPRGVKIHGKLLKNGQPADVEFVGKTLPPGETGRMRVTMYPVKNDNDRIVNENGETLEPGVEMVTVEPNGTFHLETTGGVKSGKYRFVITHIDPSSGQDVLKGVFNEFNSKITRDVTPDKEIVIDLGKPTGQ
jgi:hypothetical protein